jgi:hypothetical protein
MGRDERSGASSVKYGPKKLLSVAFPTRGLLSVSTRADTPSTSESKSNSPKNGGGDFCPVRERNSRTLFHSSVVMLQQWMGKWKGSSKTSRIENIHIKIRDMMVAQHAPCLGNEFVKFAYKVFEDKLHSSALGCFSEEDGHTVQRTRTYGFDVSSISLSAFAVISSGPSEYCECEVNGYSIIAIRSVQEKLFHTGRSKLGGGIPLLLIGILRLRTGASDKAQVTICKESCESVIGRDRDRLSLGQPSIDTRTKVLVYAR